MQETRRIKRPGKQRKRVFNAPAHLRHKFLAAPLSAELVSSKGAKTMPLRKGDTVRVMRGDHAGFEGKVSRVDLKNYRIFLEGLSREKVDGTNVFVSIHPSKVMIRNLNLDDKWRKSVVERKKQVEKPERKSRKRKVIEPVTKSPEPEAEVPIEKKAVAKKTSAKKASKISKTPVKPKTVGRKKKEEKVPKAKKQAPKKEGEKVAKKPRAKRKTASKSEGGA